MINKEKNTGLFKECKDLNRKLKQNTIIALTLSLIFSIVVNYFIVTSEYNFDEIGGLFEKVCVVLMTLILFFAILGVTFMAISLILDKFGIPSILSIDDSYNYLFKYRKEFLIIPFIKNKYFSNIYFSPVFSDISKGELEILYDNYNTVISSSKFKNSTKEIQEAIKEEFILRSFNVNDLEVNVQLRIDIFDVLDLENGKEYYDFIRKNYNLSNNIISLESDFTSKNLHYLYSASDEDVLIYFLGHIIESIKKATYSPNEEEYTGFESSDDLFTKQKELTEEDFFND